jgi:hypothetical protein
MRLDAFVAHHVPRCGRRSAAALCAAGDVTVDGRRRSKGAALVPNATVVVRVRTAHGRAPEFGAGLVVVLERDDLVIVDKPAGQPTAPRTPHERGTLVNALLGRYPDLLDVGFGGLEPGIVHRLDNQTSGLVIAARCPQAFTRLRAAITAELLDKRYLAVVEDRALPPVGEVTAPVVPTSGAGGPRARRPDGSRGARVASGDDALSGRRPRGWARPARGRGAAGGAPPDPRSPRQRRPPDRGDAVYGGAAHRRSARVTPCTRASCAGTATRSSPPSPRPAPLPPELAGSGHGARRWADDAAAAPRSNRSRVLRRAVEPERLREAEHHVHVLQRGARLALHQVVDVAYHAERPRSLVAGDGHQDPLEPGTSLVPPAR